MGDVYSSIINIGSYIENLNVGIFFSLKMYTQYIHYLTMLNYGINIGSRGLVYHVQLNFYNGIHLIAVIYSVVQLNNKASKSKYY